MDAMSFETEEILLLKSEKIGIYGGYIGVGALFFDPSGGTTSGTSGKINLVLNGGSGSSRMSASTKILFITPFVVHYKI